MFSLILNHRPNAAPSATLNPKQVKQGSKDGGSAGMGHGFNVTVFPAAINAAASACPWADSEASPALVPPDRLMVQVVTPATTHRRRTSSTLAALKAQPLSSIPCPSVGIQSGAEKFARSVQPLARNEGPPTVTRDGSDNDTSDVFPLIKKSVTTVVRESRSSDSSKGLVPMVRLPPETETKSPSCNEVISDPLILKTPASVMGIVQATASMLSEMDCHSDSDNASAMLKPKHVKQG